MLSRNSGCAGKTAGSTTPLAAVIISFIESRLFMILTLCRWSVGGLEMVRPLKDATRKYLVAGDAELQPEKPLWFRWKFQILLLGNRGGLGECTDAIQVEIFVEIEAEQVWRVAVFNRLVEQIA